jgi:esterase/lipase
MKKLFCILLLANSFFTNAQERNITITINDGKIEGTFNQPKKSKKLVIIIAGSGPTDRNGNNPLGVKCNSYQLIADTLNKANIASIRYDKRGIAKSKLLVMDESKMTFEDFINDAVTIFNYAKDSLGYKKIYFAGHSEGSLIGMVAAQRVHAAGYISISGAGQSIDLIINEQVKSQPEKIREEVKTIMEQLQQQKFVDSVPKYLYSLFRPSVQPYMISWLQYNPTAEIKKLTIPILIIQGKCDVQVKTEQATQLHEANAKSKIKLIDLMTHTLKNTTDDCTDKNKKTYTDPSLPLNQDFAKTIVNFINKH